MTLAAFFPVRKTPNALLSPDSRATTFPTVLLDNCPQHAPGRLRQSPLNASDVYCASQVEPVLGEPWESP
jgi:hypothetical protein